MPPLLCKLVVPSWALTEVFGSSPMYWHRLECSLGRSSLVGTIVQAAEGLPGHLLADEKHATMAGEKVYLADTADFGCCPRRLALPESAGKDDLEAHTECSGMRRGDWTRITAPRRSTPKADRPHRRPGGRCSRG